jgi:hypothetical protein
MQLDQSEGARTMLTLDERFGMQTRLERERTHRDELTKELARIRPESQQAIDRQRAVETANRMIAFLEQTLR